MLTRTVLAALAVAAVAAGGSTTVLVTATGNEHGLAQRSPRATEAQAKDTESEDVTTAEVELPPCPADVKNHGAYVSSVAKMNRGHAEDDSDTDDTNHGALVSAAAQSDCGKPAGGDESTADSTENEATKAEKDAAKAARKAAKTQGKSDEARAAAPGQATTTP